MRRDGTGEGCGSISRSAAASAVRRSHGRSPANDRGAASADVIFTVEVAKAARLDLVDQHSYVAEMADENVADQYVDRIAKRINSLDHFPERGSLQPQFGPGVRSLSFERKLMILYHVDGQTVLVLRILDGRRETDPSTVF
ncbi:MAG: type II toxin-antitoxin system RelE/ParE family toxin [Sphingomonadales bacterium]|nr:type II toxin-antitoxin system RelE/ParE family toxin [Sphingomonadales bacterium]